MTTQSDPKYILVVDDEADVARYLAALLEDAGFEVDVAHDGDRALEMVEQRTPDLISLDLVMPAKSGTRFLYALRKKKDWARIPVLIVTGHARDDMGKRDLEEILAGKVISGPETYLEKPVRPAGYVAAVCRQLGIEEPSGPTPAAAPREELESEIQELLERASPDEIRAILEQLRGRSGGER